MSQAGYTLAEALAALLMVGLAVGGLVEGAHVIGRHQFAAVRAQRGALSEFQARRALERLFAQCGPFLSDETALQGDGGSLGFTCEGRHRGAEVQKTKGMAQLRTRGADGRSEVVDLGARDLRFAYASADGEQTSWPVGGPKRQSLQAVVLVEARSGGSRPIAIARLWNEQAADCQFDDVLGDCRRGGQ